VFAQVAQLLGMSPGAVNDKVRKLAAALPHEREEAGPIEVVPTTRDPGERLLVGALLNRPDLFDTELSDGRPLSETLSPADFVDPEAKAVFAALSDWLHDRRELEPTQFREVFPDETSLRLAYDMQLEVDQMVESKAELMPQEVVRNAQAILARRAEMDYQRHKLEMRPDPANDSASDPPPPDREARRLVDALPHLAGRPAVRRVPRIVGTQLRP
jgi:hypothetical protein